MSHTLDITTVHWEIVDEGDGVKVRPAYDAVMALPDGPALWNIGACRPHAAFSGKLPNAKALAQKMVDDHNATLP